MSTLNPFNNNNNLLGWKMLSRRSQGAKVLKFSWQGNLSTLLLTAKTPVYQWRTVRRELGRIVPTNEPTLHCTVVTFWQNCANL
jgi:hypothetical protein